MNREVVVTGLGLVTPWGSDPNVVFSKLVAGESAICPITRFDVSSYPTNFAGEIKDFSARGILDEKEASRTSRYIQYVMKAAMDAVIMAGLDQKVPKLERAGMILGSGIGGMEIFSANSAQLETKGIRRVSPFFIPMSITNMGSGMMAMKLGWRGPNWSVSSACATGNHAIISAADQIRLGKADIMLAGGAEESVCPVSVAGFSMMRALSRRCDEPQKASRPFDKDRDGFVLGEGSGVLVLEEREHALARGATILASIKGYGASCDAYHMSAPLENGEGVALAIEQALADAGIAKEEVGLVNAHATSTPLGDAAEVKALRRVFGTHIKNLKIHATKSMLGHLLGGASAIEATILVMSLQKQMAHPTINVDNQDPECDIDCVANVAAKLDVEFGISNSFGFGGHNSCVVMGKG